MDLISLRLGEPDTAAVRGATEPLILYLDAVDLGDPDHYEGRRSLAPRWDQDASEQTKRRTVSMGVNPITASGETLRSRHTILSRFEVGGQSCHFAGSIALAVCACDPSVRHRSTLLIDYDNAERALSSIIRCGQDQALDLVALPHV